ncbi:MAG: CUAEP/CCAEP-tail radical SAM protein, partial [Gammaproteobacteria bacterium]|nr:CUAEP/CCAEP-tail radical SAM protein [Gammaproteobacteria bacterium]
MPVCIALINTYELGRQPFGLAQPAAWLRDAGHRVDCLDLAVEPLEEERVSRADLIAVHLPMHTATRIAIEILPRLRRAAPDAVLCAYGLYAPVNEPLLRKNGIDCVFGGEVEPAIVSLAERVARNRDRIQREPVVNLEKIAFRPPDRSGLPPLGEYASLVCPDGSSRTVGFTEATRGCKHVCRHCPVVPVYQGRFRVVPLEVVMSDIRAQVDAGAEHISFGDPDFFNGPTHALRICRALHDEFPQLSYDATIKIEHVLRYRSLFPELAATGCLFVTTAAESVDDEILARLDKGHTRADFFKAVRLLCEAGIGVAPTFVPFTPWTTVGGYVELLESLIELKLVQSVPPVQLAIRLLVPRGSYLFRLPGFEDLVGPFDEAALGYPWTHEDPAVDELQRDVQGLVERVESAGQSRRQAFESVYRLACAR